MGIDRAATKVNLLPPFILALCVSTLRMGAQELFRPDNEKTQGMSVVEFTAIKLCLSSITALSLAMLCETRQHNWWGALMEESNAGILLMLLGAVFVLIFQARPQARVLKVQSLDCHRYWQSFYWAYIYVLCI